MSANNVSFSIFIGNEIATTKPPPPKNNNFKIKYNNIHSLVTVMSHTEDDYMKVYLFI